MLDLALYLMDFPAPSVVSGMTYNNRTDLSGYTYQSMWGRPVPGASKDVEDSAFAQIRFRDGQCLQLGIAWAINLVAEPQEQVVRLMGERAGIELRGLDSLHHFGEDGGRLTDTRVLVSPVDEFASEFSRFRASVLEGAPTAATAEQGLLVQQLLDAVYGSALSGREVVMEEAVLAASPA